MENFQVNVQESEMKVGMIQRFELTEKDAIFCRYARCFPSGRMIVRLLTEFSSLNE
jgi:hypothetical protein